MKRHSSAQYKRWNLKCKRIMRNIYYRILHYGAKILKWPSVTLNYCLGSFLYKKAPMCRKDMNYRIFSKEHGRYGEFQLWRKARKCFSDNTYWLSNLYLPKGDGTTCEIDLIAISDRGIFVFESKNYNGWIYGDTKRPYWYQMIRRDIRRKPKKFSFFNPIMQNAMHCRVLREIANADDKIVHSFVVFGDQCTLKEVCFDPKKSTVCKNNSVGRCIRKYKKESLSRGEIERIYRLLKQYTDVSFYEKMTHIEKIQEKK